MKDGNGATPALVITFPSTHQALKCDRLFKSKIKGFQLMPVPRQISSSCGLAIKVPGLSLEQLVPELAAAGIEYDGVYSFSSNNNWKCLHVQ